MFKKIVWLWFQSKWKNAKDVKKYIKSLVDSWATEFFTGYNPTYWSDKFGFEVSPNWRFAEHEQITDFETLQSIVEEVHNYDLEVFINLNAWYYTDITFEYIQKMVWEFIQIWVDWIICWNVWILEYLKEINYKWKINISTIMALYNTESIRFFVENYDINKVILSREITLKEIEKLTSNFPNTKFEVFWEWDFCRYNNGLCYAEHKYWARDICTVVFDDLVIKKRFNPDFKKIILDENMAYFEKNQKFDKTYKNIFEELDNILNDLELDYSLDLQNKLLKILKQISKRTDLFFDRLETKDSLFNSKIFTYLKWINYLLNLDISLEDREFFISEKNIITQNIKSWIDYNLSKIKFLQSSHKLEAIKTNLTYSKWDNLNLYSYLFFNNIKNIETVKFPTRWRNYNEKLLLIEETIKNAKVDEKYIDRWISPKRTHYDLSYIFWNKNRFLDFINK